MLKSKIHRARVTGTDITYEGSIVIDKKLMDAVGMIDYEQVQIYDVTNGQRLTTYCLAGEAGKGEVIVNGAAAILVKKNDTIIIAAYAQFSEEELYYTYFLDATKAPKLMFKPKIIKCNNYNGIWVDVPHGE